MQRRVGPAGAAAAEVSRVTVGGETPAETHPSRPTAPLVAPLQLPLLTLPLKAVWAKHCVEGALN